MKIISYNVNGIRAAIKKGWLDWAKAVDADIICLQETKAHVDQLNISLFKELGYHSYWFSADKKGYSGVAILSKTEPTHVEYGCGNPAYDFEGRCIRADFDNISVMSVYMPSGSNPDRIAFKAEWNNFFTNYIASLNVKTQLVVSGDFNVCHQAIDIHNPIANKYTSGFLPSERAWLDHFFEMGFIDSFRYFNEEPHNYTWWSYMARARTKNLGWRIDYHAVAKELEKELKRSVILKDAVHSDHCPILLELNL